MSKRDREFICNRIRMMMDQMYILRLEDAITEATYEHFDAYLRDVLQWILSRKGANNE